MIHRILLSAPALKPGLMGPEYTSTELSQHPGVPTRTAMTDAISSVSVFGVVAAQCVSAAKQVGVYVSVNEMHSCTSAWEHIHGGY